jgi:hypothetical protein
MLGFGRLTLEEKRQMGFLSQWAYRGPFHSTLILTANIINLVYVALSLSICMKGAPTSIYSSRLSLLVVPEPIRLLVHTVEVGFAERFFVRQEALHVLLTCVEF